jgi:putative ABC transport system permease protein
MRGAAGGLFPLVWRGAWHRRGTLGLTALAIALAVTLLLATERLRAGAEAGFRQAASGVDLVVGAPGHPVELLLKAVFRLGGGAKPVDPEILSRLRALPGVQWAVPLALGDSHRGYPVVATEAGYFTHWRLRERTGLTFEDGRAFGTAREVVLGGEVASALGYRVGDELVLAHGDGQGPAAHHDDHPFVVSGILSRTGTPVDRSLHIDLAAFGTMHSSWVGGLRLPPSLPVGASTGRPGPSEADSSSMPLPRLDAVLVGLHARGQVFAVKRWIDDYRDEPLMAVLPGVALDQLAGFMDAGQGVLRAVSSLVVVLGLAGLVAVVLTSLRERRRELAILRANGASPGQIAILLCLEGALVTAVGALLGFVVTGLVSAWAGPWIETRYGLVLDAAWFEAADAWRLLAVVVGGALVSLLPAWRAYRQSLADGLTPEV